ncbi:PAS domain-containing protein [Inhella inkyongensis]|uniref:PAS domain-containing protein n=1 Tax=Inhella inkyongensis TaxID=392593 RepID=A0A840S8V4_9BURK|nr:GAF domain-containing protein [Inhella inkyongensis]MBB5206073.1 PAS domain-containing protein [Inhella inkyongensis]
MPFDASPSVWIWVLLTGSAVLLGVMLGCRWLGGMRKGRVQAAAAMAEAPPLIPSLGPSDWASLAQGLSQTRDEAAALQFTLSHLARPLALGAALAALWDPPTQRLRAVARWGGEGAELPASEALALLQQCALSARPQCLDEASSAGLRIRSGLGAMAPRSLLLWPVRQAGQVLAVLELASLRKLTPADQQALKDLEPLLALVLQSHAAALRAEPVQAGPAAAGAVDAAASDTSALMLVRQAPLPMALYAESGRALALSAAWAQWLGLAPDLAASRNLLSLWMRPESQVELLRQLHQQPQLQGWTVELAHAQGHALAARMSACRVQVAGQSALLLMRGG